MKSIKVKFINQWDPKCSPVPGSICGHILAKNYNLILDAENPDYVITQSYDLESIGEYNDKVVIFETGEAVVPDFNLVDYAIGYDDISFSDRYFQFPYQLLNWKEDDSECSNKEAFSYLSFCNFIYSNAKAHPLRDEFYQFLSNYQKIDSFGRHLNNMQCPPSRTDKKWQQIKLAIQSKYKFTIAFENASHDGYTTEKICDAFLAKTIPIYFGNLSVDKLFNTDAFIWIKTGDDFSSALEKIKEIESNENLFNEMLSMKKLSIDLELKHKELELFLKSIIERNLKDSRRKALGTSQSNYVKRNKQSHSNRVEGSCFNKKRRRFLRDFLKRLKNLRRNRTSEFGG